jgi:hypothetical protein
MKNFWATLVKINSHNSFLKSTANLNVYDYEQITRKQTVIVVDQHQKLRDSERVVAP